MMDALSDIVSRARIMGRIDFQAALTADRGVCFSKTRGEARYHMIADGECWATIDGEPTPIQLKAVSLLIIPRGTAHSISGLIDTPAQAFVPFETLQKKGLRKKQRSDLKDVENSDAFLVSGIFEMDLDFGELLLDELPDCIHLPLGNMEDMRWLRDAVKFIAYEVAEGAPGTAAIADRLGEVIFMETIKTVAKTAATGVLASLRDPNIGAALTAFHNAPANKWTVATLAKEAGVSRTVFAERANALLGMTPMQYVRDWRLMLAHRLLKETDCDAEQIAGDLGYTSISNFVKAYRDFYGIDPLCERY